MAETGGLNEYGEIRRLALRHARDAFGDRGDSWRALGYRAAPDVGAAIAEYDAFAQVFEDMGCLIDWLPGSSALGLDSIYVRDAGVLLPGGLALARMGKSARAAEPAALATAVSGTDLAVAGAIEPPGRLEGGDVVWFDAETVAVGEGYRTDAAGIEQFSRLVGPSVEVVVCPLPHWRGPADVFHLMSIISPLAADLALVCSPLMPVPARRWLESRGIVLVEVAADEFDSLGGNVLALAPRKALMVEGNPRTRARLERAGVEVLCVSGREIAHKGQGGPTCLTRPLSRGRLSR